MSAGGGKPPRPALKSLLLCDQIIQEVGTQKKSLVGVFHNIQAATFPCTHPTLALYASLTDAAGAYSIEVRLVHLATNDELAKATLPPLEVLDRLAPAEICIQMQLLQFPAPGKYEVQLFANGDPIGSRDFTVSQAETSAGQPSPDDDADRPPDAWPPG